MRNILLVFFTLCGVLVKSAGISDITQKALAHMQLGYVSYAVGELKRAVSVNDIAAQFYMAQCYESGIGIDQDLKQAFLMYRQAAERGLVDAMVELSRCYRNGIGVMENATRAEEWQKRYDSRYKGSSLPNLNGIYQEGSSHPENYALHPNGVDDQLGELTKVASMPASEVASRLVIQSMEPPIDSVRTSPKPTMEEKSDVDVNIPNMQKLSENVFAVIIANENYQDVPKVPNALNDGDVFAQYCCKVLGLPLSNIHVVRDATLNNIKRQVNWMRQVGESYSGKASFIVYYAGHGIPDESTHNAFLLPIDGFVADLTTCYSLSDFYDMINGIPSLKTIVLLDACFSGAVRGDGMLASARGVAIKPKKEVVKGNLVVFSAVQGDETAYPYSEKRHGMFTYYLLKKLQESCGEATLGSIVEYVRDNVSRRSIVINGKSQTPSTITSETVGAYWQDWKLY